jgi:hypothetical protein
MSTSSDVAQWLLAAGGVAGVTGGIVSVFQSRAARRKIDGETEKIDADRADTINTMALRMLEPMQRRIEHLTADVGILEPRIVAVTDRLTLAQRLLDANNIPFPPAYE